LAPSLQPVISRSRITDLNQETVNDHAIHICALRRSGHHAIIQWILNNGGKPGCFLNDCTPCTNPYLSALSNSLCPSIDAERRGEFSKKALFVANYEDRRLEDTFPLGFADATVHWIGASTRTTNLLILRDPFNLIASKIRWAVHGHRNIPPLDSLTSLPELWKSHARAYLGSTSIPQTTLTNVSYNRWFTDHAYRQSLAIELGISTGDEGRNRVAQWGPNVWGDSFDNMTLDGRATEMKVLERWKNYATDRFFRHLVQDRELIDLSLQIFGPLPGSEVLLD
jgi:hypothetical protein